MPKNAAEEFWLCTGTVVERTVYVALLTALGIPPGYTAIAFN
jgi:hypothetical protein